MTRINEKIRAPKVRVVMHTGEQLGVMSVREAVEKAKSIGLDLVEVAATVSPPVCRIVDYGKYKYEQSKLKKKKAKTMTRIKEIKVRVGTDTHDYNIKLARAEKFLYEGSKVRVRLQFRGRENAHREIGFEVVKQVAVDLAGIAVVDQQARLAGRAINMMLSPLPKEQRQRKYFLSHGSLIENDDDDSELPDDEDDVQDDAPQAQE
ncbi:translation initiation factor IF-3 [Persicirhabdus sediminis]|uniref:Translation initiation factor IF-3 n=1 Tax=Persicirhabdus sediminis TaxID=454144 RepID=A0A8J7MDU6_9BACT|nr:translation initiation factor IF-3 [Persicirhabdus sediminis]MBK1791436.1 translation initiation factor IF-3 [Persicirhabdus sediminis]